MKLLKFKHLENDDIGIYHGAGKVGIIEKEYAYNGERDAIRLYSAWIQHTLTADDQWEDFGVRGDWWADKDDFISGNYGMLNHDDIPLFHTSGQALAAAKKWAEKSYRDMM